MSRNSEFTTNLLFLVTVTVSMILYGVSITLVSQNWCFDFTACLVDFLGFYLNFQTNTSKTTKPTNSHILLTDTTPTPSLPTASLHSTSPPPDILPVPLTRNDNSASQHSQPSTSVPSIHSLTASLICLYTNATSLNRSKLNELETIISSDPPDIIFITETWFNEYSSTNLNNYYTFRSDRPSHGGGVAIFVRMSLNPKTFNSFSTKLSEQIWIELNLPTESLLLGCIYRPPASSNSSNNVLLISPDNEININLLHAKKLIDTKKYGGLLLAGDFNFPNISWGPDGFVQCLGAPSNPAAKFLKNIEDLSLIQHVNFPTFKQTDNRLKNTLDYIISEAPERVSNLICLPPLGDTEQGHLILSWSYNLYVPFKPAKISSTRYNFKKGDYTKLNSHFKSIDWSSNFSSNDINTCYNFLMSTYTSACDKFIPIIKTSRTNKFKNAWMTNDILNLIKRKKHLFYKNLSLKWNNPELVADFKKCRGDVKKAIKKRVTNYEMEIVNDKSNPKRLFAYTNSKLKTNSNINSLTVNSCTVTNPSAIANSLNDQFQSVFVDESNDNYLPQFSFRTRQTLCLARFDQSSVQTLLHQLKQNKSQGTDKIHAYVLQAAAESLSLPLSMLFSLSFSSGTIPTSWAEANVTPIFKKGLKSNPANYRPISLTSVPCKIMEKIVTKTIKSYLNKHDLITPCQHGFVSKKACVTNLLETYDILTTNKLNKKCSDMVLLDFAKAFDKVPHKLLLHKLSRYGLNSYILNWIHSFLTARKQRVILGNVHSNWTHVSSGVPQGSVIGPLLFIIYINDLPDNLTSTVLMFADDTKLIATIDPSNHIPDSLALQNDLNSVTDWTKTWKMELNMSKCKIIHFGKQNAHHEYHLQDHNTMLHTTITKSNAERDLGIIISSDLKSSTQSCKAAAKANSILGIMKRTFTSRDPSLWKKIYTTYIRPHLEFAISSWNPSLTKDIKIIEQVQRRSTKVPNSLRNLCYADRCKKLKLTSLTDRRTRGDLIQYYKIHNNIDIVNWFSPPKIAPPRAGNRAKLRRELVKNCNERHNFFTNRIVPHWNNLPEGVAASVSVNSFKNRFDKLQHTFPHLPP